MSDADTDLVLNVQERRTTVHAKVLTYLTARLEQARRKNDSESLDAIATAAQRGRIAELKNLLNLLAAGDSQD